ncbi:MHYT domain-containing protein [Paenibacillus sp. TAB 01]|uniref:MHYT domain-containing protein n=1 Tax=Paenibacillus sp. TAB 01 TaxID=3368988 RepID=UPI003752EE6C
MVHLQGHYNVPVVLLSFFIAVLAAYSALSLSEKIAKTQGRTKTVWLISGACVMGCGVWAMHFVGMIAYHLNVEVSYNIPVTIVSLLASILASFIAFRVSADPKAGLAISERRVLSWEAGLSRCIIPAWRRFGRARR